MEPAARRRIDEVGDRATDGLQFALIDAKARERADQPDGIGVLRCLEDLARAARLHDVAGVHDKDSIADLVDDHLWILSTLTPPGSKTIVLGLLCPRCAERIYPPEVLRAAEEARQKRRLLS